MNRDFQKFALSRGISSSKLYDYINPYVIEERQMNITSLDIFSRLMLDRQIFLGTEIDGDVANIIVAQLLWLDQQSNGDVTIICNSGGGNVYDGLAIVDTMNYINSDVSTNVVGMAASMAAVIASSGTKGKRFILPHSRFMIHQPLSGSNGFKQASDLEIQVNEINNIKRELYQILSENSGIPYEEIEKMGDRDNWLTANEAIEKGFLDQIIAKK